METCPRHQNWQDVTCSLWVGNLLDGREKYTSQLSTAPELKRLLFPPFHHTHFVLEKLYSFSVFVAPLILSSHQKDPCHSFTFNILIMTVNHRTGALKGLTTPSAPLIQTHWENCYASTLWANHHYEHNVSQRYCVLLLADRTEFLTFMI